MFFPIHDQNNATVKTTPYASFILIGLNLLIFAYQILLEEGGMPFESELFLLRFGLNPSLFGELEKTSFNLVTYSFLHGSFMHIFGNLWFFYIFADNVEECFGSAGFLLFYLISGLSGGVIHLVFSTNTLIGASGAVAGVMGAYILLFPRHRITCYFCPIWFFIRRIDVPAWLVLGFYLLFQAAALIQPEIMKTNVAFDCHIGGFLTGVLAGWLFRKWKPAPAAAYH